MRTPAHLGQSGPRRGPICGPRRPIHPPTDRTVFFLDKISVWGWPSRGGLIVLERATTLDLEFLGLDRLHPPLRRDPNQELEDQLCQRLLLLGAKWFDSRHRYEFVYSVLAEHEPDVLEVESGMAQAPTTMERRWVSVGLPSGAEGGLWVLEFDSSVYGLQEKHNSLPRDVARVTLAKTMDEKCDILKGLGAKFYKCLEQYEGAACLQAWEQKTQGEFGPLFRTQYQEE